MLFNQFWIKFSSVSFKWASLTEWQIEMKGDLDRFAWKKKELSEQILNVENQLEWTRSEKDEEIKKFTAERRVLQDRLHEAEMQLSQLKSRKRDELKVNGFPFTMIAALLLLIFLKY